VNDPAQFDTQPVIPERPLRSWLESPPLGYVPLPLPSLTLEAADYLQPAPDADHIGALFGNLETSPGPEADSVLLPLDAHPGHLTADDSDIIMDVGLSGSDEELELGDLGLETGTTAEIPVYGSVAPKVQDDSDEEMELGNFDREEFEMRDEETPTALSELVESDEEIDLGNLGLVESESDEEIDLGHLGLEFVDTGTWAESDSDGFEARDRPRVHIMLPRVNPETGLFTADSFANVPNEWLD
jgi:hypothetical protein